MAHRPAMERVCSISCEQMHTRRTGENVCGACDDTSQARCSYRLPCAEDNVTEDRAAAARLLRAADLHGPGLRFRGSPAQTDSWERSTAALVPGKAERVASGVARSRRPLPALEAFLCSIPRQPLLKSWPQSPLLSFLMGGGGGGKGLADPSPTSPESASAAWTGWLAEQ